MPFHSFFMSRYTCTLEKMARESVDDSGHPLLNYTVVAEDVPCAMTTNYEQVASAEHGYQLVEVTTIYIPLEYVSITARDRVSNIRRDGILVEGQSFIVDAASPRETILSSSIKLRTRKEHGHGQIN